VISIVVISATEATVAQTDSLLLDLEDPLLIGVDRNAVLRPTVP
jgi:hypothetical protein